MAHRLESKRLVAGGRIDVSRERLLFYKSSQTTGRYVADVDRAGAIFGDFVVGMQSRPMDSRHG